MADRTDVSRRLHRGGSERRSHDHGRRDLDHRVRRLRRRGPAERAEARPELRRVRALFGGLSALSTMSYAVYQYFLNGGRDALIVRTARLTARPPIARRSRPSPPAPARASSTLEAASEGVWGDRLRVRIDHDVGPTSRGRSTSPSRTSTRRRSRSSGTCSVTATDANYARSRPREPVQAPACHRPALGAARGERRPCGGCQDPFEDPSSIALAGGADGAQAVTDLVPASSTDKTGMYALEKADLFNLLCIPPVTRDREPDARTRSSEASKYCADDGPC